MKQNLVIFLSSLVLSLSLSKSAPTQEHHMKGMHDHMKHHEKMPPKSALKPAEGASVKILSPRPGQAFKGDEIPLHFKLIKGKIGNHVHAYVDGKLMGMFKRDEGILTGEGTLTGIPSGHHTLELRVVAEDHQTELDATDEVHFMVK